LPTDDDLPDYEPMLAAYHEALAPELEAIIGTLPIARGARVLDLACGDGDYGRWLAGRVGPSGLVVGVDILPAYLDAAHDAASRGPTARVARFLRAPIERLPFADGAFDAAWCAQSFYSLPDPVEALRHMVRVVKPGGLVAVLEGDTLHHVLLPWPVEVELAVRRAELLAFAEESDKPRKFYVGRLLLPIFRAAGLADARLRTWATDRTAPLSRPARDYLAHYLKNLRDRVAPFLEPDPLAALDRLIDPGSADNLLDLPDFAVTFLDQVVWAVKPQPSGG